MARSNVPEFGKWEKEENIPYTMYFDNARKNRGAAKTGNPNDPLDFPDMQPNVSPKPRARQEESVGKGVEGGHGDFWHSPGPKAVNESNYGLHGQHPARSPIHPHQGRSPQPAIGSESPLHHMQPRSPKPNHGFEKSPVHPPQQAKLVARPSGSPAIEGRGRDSSNGRNGRSRMTQSKDQGTTVPRFGQWNEKDQSAENFTDIFEKVREEKNSLAGTTPKHNSSSARSQGSYKPHETKKSCGCFPW